MRKQFVLNILIFCATLSRGIEASSEKKDESSSILVRKKRIIDHSPRPLTVLTLADVPYIVNIRKNGTLICGGSILFSNIIATAAHCVAENNARYTILSGTIEKYTGTSHIVTQKFIYPHYNESNPSCDLALLKIWPPIDFMFTRNRKININNAPPPENSFGTLSGWGCIYKAGNHMMHGVRLRSIYVPILNWRECSTMYLQSGHITHQNICTFDLLKKSCYGDDGGPLVVNGFLAGILTWSGGMSDTFLRPDVYVNLADPNIKEWIETIIRAHRFPL